MLYIVFIIMEGSKEEEEGEYMNRRELLETEERIDKRRFELLAETVEIAESVGITTRGEVENMNNKVPIVENLNKLKKMFRHDFFVAFGYKKG